MNIWLVHQYAIPPSQAGFTRPFDFARALIRRGHQVTVVAAGFDHMAQRESRQYGRDGYLQEMHDGVRFIWLETPRYFGSGVMRVWNMIVFAWRVCYGAWSAGLPKPDVIIGSSPSLFAAYGAERLSWRMRKPFVLEIRDLWPDSLVELGSYSRLNPLIGLLRVMERYLYRRAARIVGVQQFLEPYLLANGAMPNSYTWLPNGSPLLESTIPDRERNHSTFTAMYAGSFSGTNAAFLRLLIDVAERLSATEKGRRVLIRLIGDGPERHDLLRQVALKGLKNIRIEAPVAKSEIAQVLTGADVFLLAHPDSPLFRWGMSPNKLADYLAIGRPILSVVRTDHNPIGETGACIVVSPEPEAIAGALVELSEKRPEDIERIGGLGRSFAMSHHFLPALAERLEGVLSSALAAPVSR